MQERFNNDPDEFDPTHRPVINNKSSELSVERRLGTFGTHRSTRAEEV